MNPTDRVTQLQTGNTRIGTARDHIGLVRVGRSTLLKWFEAQARARFFPFDRVPRGQVYAEVNHGRWMVKCPICQGCELADWREPVFYCLSCGNAENDSHVMDVVFPDDREIIEATLMRRPIENRNWSQSESAMQLLRENFAHGVK